jgi:plastocyanin
MDRQSRRHRWSAPTAEPLVLVLALVLALAAGCSPPGGDDGGGADAPAVSGVTTVVAKDMRFQPPAIQVPVGTAVTWTFQDGQIPHDVAGGGWTSGEPKQTGSFRHTFAATGTYAYRCSVHPGMTGRVVVQP